MLYRNVIYKLEYFKEKKDSIAALYNIYNSRQKKRQASIYFTLPDFIDVGLVQTTIKQSKGTSR